MVTITALCKNKFNPFRKLTESCPCLEFNELDFESESSESELAFFDSEKSEFNISELLCLSIVVKCIQKIDDFLGLTRFCH